MKWLGKDVLFFSPSQPSWPYRETFPLPPAHKSDAKTSHAREEHVTMDAPATSTNKDSASASGVETATYCEHCSRLHNKLGNFPRIYYDARIKSKRIIAHQSCLPGYVGELKHRIEKAERIILATDRSRLRRFLQKDLIRILRGRG